MGYIANTSPRIPKPDQVIQAAADQHFRLEGMEADLQTSMTSKQNRPRRGVRERVLTEVELLDAF
jgi:hypothetical protein